MGSVASPLGAAKTGFPLGAFQERTGRENGANGSAKKIPSAPGSGGAPQRLGMH